MNSIPRRPSIHDSSFEMESPENTNDLFFTEMDKNILCDAKCFQNNPMALIKITMPCLISLGFCPLTLYLLEPMVNFFWPPPEYEIPEYINDAISAFLVPAGLVYAIAFGFALQDTIEKLKDVSNYIDDHASAIKQIAFLTSESPLYSKSQKMDILKSLKNSTLYWTRAKLMGQTVVKPLYDGMCFTFYASYVITYSIRSILVI